MSHTAPNTFNPIIMRWWGDIYLNPLMMGFKGIMRSVGGHLSHLMIMGLKVSHTAPNTFNPIIMRWWGDIYLNLLMMGLRVLCAAWEDIYLTSW